MEPVSKRPSVLKVSINIKKGNKPLKYPGRNRSRNCLPTRRATLLFVNDKFNKTNNKNVEIIKKNKKFTKETITVVFHFRKER